MTLGLQEVQKISVASWTGVQHDSALQRHAAGVPRRMSATTPSSISRRPKKSCRRLRRRGRQILPKLPQLFDVLPKAPYEIRALPDSSRHSLDNGYFAPAAADGSRPGILWMNIYATGRT